MRVLVISGLPWNMNNNFGSTFSSIFSGMDDIEFLNIYCGYGLPDNNLDVESVQITELSLLKNILNPNQNEPFIHVTDEQKGKKRIRSEQKNVDKIRKYNNRVVFWGRCFIWKIGRWKSKDLQEKIVDFNPDLIFSILYYNPYLNNLILYCHNVTNAPIAIYSTDDVYSLHKFSLSPFYWIERLIIRNNIKKIVQQCELCYTITNEQKKEYQKYFKKTFKVITKGDTFNELINIKKVCRPIDIVYTGAVYGGRFSTLRLLMEAMEECNNKGNRFILHIYSYYTLKKREKRIVEKYSFVYWMGGLPATEMERVQSEADILLHIESLRLSESLEVRHSFSTKLVDYFKSGRAILAIGRKKCASCAYLVKNKCGYVAESKRDLINYMNYVYKNPEKLEVYAKRAFVIGKTNHDISTIQRELKSDFERIIDCK